MCKKMEPIIVMIEDKIQAWLVREFGRRFYDPLTYSVEKRISEKVEELAQLKELLAGLSSVGAQSDNALTQRCFTFEVTTKYVADKFAKNPYWSEPNEIMFAHTQYSDRISLLYPSVYFDQ